MVFALFLTAFGFNVSSHAATSNCKITYNKNTKNGIKIKWSNKKKVSGYQVYRSVNNGKYKLLKKLTSKNLTDRSVKVGKAYKYKVRSYSYKYNFLGIRLKKQYQRKSAASKKIIAVPKAVVSVMHDILTDRISLTWTKQTGVDEYVIYRSMDEYNYGEIARVSADTTTFDDFDIQAGMKYTYKVQCVKYIKDVTYNGVMSSMSFDFNDVKSKNKYHKINIDTKKLHPYLQDKLNLALKNCAEEGIYLIITEGFRTKAYQDYLYAQGRTRKGPIITRAKGSDYASQHQWGIAFDIAINGSSKDLYNITKLTKAAAIIKDVGLGWGGDWSGFVDMPHFYLKTWGATPTSLKKKYKTPTKFKKYWTRTVSKSTYLYSSTKLKDSVIKDSIPKNSKVTVYYYKSAGYAKVKFGKLKGYIYRNTLKAVN